MTTEYDFTQIQPFIDDKGRLISLPAKHKKKLLALWYLSSKIEKDKDYTESEINDLIDDWTAFHDPATLRRELYNKMLLNRTTDCSRYWKEEKFTTLDEFISNFV